MHTRCPECTTLFKIDTKQLSQANGYVKCCRCDAIFEARRYQDKSMDDSDAKDDDGSEFDWLKTEYIDDSHLKIPTNEPADTEKHSASSLLNDYDELIDNVDDIKASDSVTLSIEELLVANKSKWLSNLFWSLIVVLLTVTIIFQIIWTNRNEAIQFNETRWLLESFCGIAKCSLPKRKDTEKIDIISSEIVLNSDAFLAIHLVINNTASYSQPYPRLEVTLLNTEEKIVAKRTFTPVQYIYQYNEDVMLPSHQLQHIQLDLVDPGEEAAGYSFRFL